MPIQVQNPYSGQVEDTCSVSFASQAHVASVHDQQTEAQFNKAKLMGEWGVIKAKAAKGGIAEGTKVMTYEGNAIEGYAYVKNGKLRLRQYTKATGKRIEVDFDEEMQNAIFSSASFKFSIPQSVLPKQDQSDTIHQMTGWDPDQMILSSYWAAVNKIKKSGKLEPGTVVAVNPDYQVRLVYKGGTGEQVYEIQVANNDGNWTHDEYVEWPQQAMSTYDEGWHTPPDTATVTPPHAAPSQAKPMTKDDFKKIQQDDTLKEGDLLAVATSTSGATQYRIVMGKTDSPWPFLLQAKGSSDNVFKQIDKADWIADLTDDGQKWYKPEKDPEPIAAPTPKPAVAQGSTSTGSMSNEDVATMFVKIKDQLATIKGVNIKGSNPELDAEVYKAIGDAIGYTPTEVKLKIDAYKATGKKLSALKKKALKQSGKPKDKPGPAVPSVLPEAVVAGEATQPDSLPGGPPTVTVTPAKSTPAKSPFQILDDTGENGDGYAAPGLWGKFGAAGVMIRNVDANGVERFLMVQRGPLVSSNKGKWQLAGGAINGKETPEQGAAREIWEEIGAPKEYLDTMTKVGTHKVEVPIPGKKPWVYSNIAADAPTMFKPKIDGTETGDAKWLTKAEIKALVDEGKMHPAVKTALPSVYGLWDDKPTEANKDTVSTATATVAEAVEANPQAVYSNEDISAAYIIAKDKIVAESNGKWTLYTKNPEMDAAIYKAVQDKTGHSEQQAKHAIALYLSDPSNKLSKLKKSLIKQGKMKAEADTLKKKKTPAEVQAEIDANATSGYTPGHTSVPPAAVPTAAFSPEPKPTDLTFTGTTLGTHAAQVWVDSKGQKWLFKPQQGFLTEVDVATATLAKKLGHPAADTYKFALNGKEGSLQRMFSGGQAFPSGITQYNVDGIGSQKVLALQKEQVLDWLFSQHDSHSANFVLDENGNMVGIDKGQAFKFFGSDTLSDSYHPNSMEKAPVYNFVWKAWQAGKPVPVNDPAADGELKDFIAKVQAIPSDELKALFRPYFEKAKAQGLFHGSVEAKLVSLVNRKNNLAKDFAKLHDDAKKARDKATKPSTPDPVTANPGDISHLSEADKAAFITSYPSGVPYASATPVSLYTQLEETIAKLQVHVDPDWKKLGKLTVLQAARILDESKAKKTGKPNENFAEKSLVTWLTTSEGKAHIQSSRKQMQTLKDKEEAKKKIAQMKASQPGLPPDSALFKDISETEARAWQNKQTPWTAPQEQALFSYTQSSHDINTRLRGGSGTPSVDTRVKNARAGMRPLERPILTHRGTDAISFGIQSYEDKDLLYGLIGKKFKQQGFSSSSFGGQAGFSDKPVIIHFECPPGTPAGFLEDISAFKGGREKEILLDHGIEVRILQVWEEPFASSWQSGNQYHVRVRVEGWEK